MRSDLLRNYVDKHEHSRRNVLRFAGAAGAAVALGAATRDTPASAAPNTGRTKDFDDVPFDYSDPKKFDDWIPGPYGENDQRGAFNEVTPQKTAAALFLLRRGRSVKTYNMGELMWNGFPAFATDPPREYDQRLCIAGFEPPAGFTEGGGIVTSTETLGVTKTSVLEERFIGFDSPKSPNPVSTTYQIGTQLDNLNHIGAKDYFYNGFRGRDICKPYGTSKLGVEHAGPVMTRGVLLDVLAVKLAKGRSQDLGEASNGQPTLAANYRITVEDLKDAMELGDIRGIGSGDAVIVRTGWNELLKRRNADDIAIWEGKNGLPGIYVREARWLAQFRPAIIGSDCWALEVLGNKVNDDGSAFPVHQELLMRNGIRIGESWVTEGLSQDRVYEFVVGVNPQYAEGATCGNTPPMALAPMRR